MTTPDLVITCTGRAVDDRLRPVGDVCGRVFTRDNEVVRLDTVPPAMVRPIPDAEYITRARAGGWSAVRIAGSVVATCPTCRKPTRETSALLRDLRQSITAPIEGSST